MKKQIIWAVAMLIAGAMIARAAPAPYPLTINSRAQTAEPAPAFRGSEITYRVTFTDSSTPSDITGCIPFMVWATNALATGVSTSSYTIVSATNGVVDFYFDPSAMNYTSGNYLYEVGVRSNSVPRVYRQGKLTIYNSPVGAGVSAVTWSTPVNWSLLDWSNLPTITVNGVTGSIETNLSFTVTGSGGGSVTSVNGQTGTVTITASGLGAITNEADTLYTVVSRGQVASNTVAVFMTDTAITPAPAFYGSSLYGVGVEGYSVASRGVYGGTVNGFGLQAEATGSGTGIFAYAATSGVGVYSPHAIISESSITANTFLGNGSALTGMTVSQIAGAYPASNPSNFVTAAQVSAADIRTPLVNVTTGATSTVTVTSAKRVYYVESDAQTTVTNDISALALNCTSNAEWEVWYNAKSTNALTPLWDSRMQFARGAPEITCTGLVKIACSSACGTIIQARQTWPTRTTWLSSPSLISESAPYGSGAGGDFGNWTASALSVYVSSPARCGRLYYVRGVFTPNSPSASDVTNVVSIAVSAPTGTAFVTNMIVNVVDGKIPFACCGFPKSFSGLGNESGRIVLKLGRVAPLSVVTTVWRLDLREADENETAYYNAGGRDFQ